MKFALRSIGFAFVSLLAGCTATLGPYHGRYDEDGGVDTGMPVFDGAVPDGAVPDGGPGDAGVDTRQPPPPPGDSGVDAPPPVDSGTDVPPSDPGCYSESVDADADISDLVSRYGGSDWKDVLIEVFERRHPATAWLLDAQRDDSYFGTFSDSRDWGRMVEWIDTLSHEETHLFNAYEAGRRGVRQTIYMRPDLMIDLDASLDGFARSEILSLVEIDAIYTNTYLTGSQGERGFIALIDETSCYLNELAALAVVGEHYPGFGVSSRDGAFAFLYYIELYLRRAREAHASFYETLRGSPAAKEIVKTLWLRTFFFLPVSERFPSLGISDAAYRDAIMEPVNLAEVRMFLGEDVGASHCIPAR